MSAMVIAPRPGAARSQPRPAGPTCRMSFAKIGSSATAPPNNTANRSSVIAARNNGLARTKRKPANTSLRARVSLAGGGLRTGMVLSITTNKACPMAAAANAAVAPPVAAISNPPAAGPMIEAADRSRRATRSRWRTPPVRAAAEGSCPPPARRRHARYRPGPAVNRSPTWGRSARTRSRGQTAARVNRL